MRSQHRKSFGENDASCRRTNCERGSRLFRYEFPHCISADGGIQSKHCLFRNHDPRLGVGAVRAFCGPSPLSLRAPKVAFTTKRGGSRSRRSDRNDPRGIIVRLTRPAFFTIDRSAFRRGAMCVIWAGMGSGGVASHSPNAHSKSPETPHSQLCNAPTEPVASCGADAANYFTHRLAFVSYSYAATLNQMATASLHDGGRTITFFATEAPRNLPRTGAGTRSSTPLGPEMY